MKHPIAFAPQLRPIPPNVVPRSPQNIAAEPAVDGLAPGNEFTVNNPLKVEQNDEHGFDRAVGLSRLLRSWRCWALPLRRLLVGLRGVPVDQRLVPSDVHRHEGSVIQDTLMEILTDFGTEILLIGGGGGGGSEAWARTLQQCGAYSNQTLGLPRLFRMIHQRRQQCR